MSYRAALDGLAQGLELALVNVRKLIQQPDPEEWIDQKRSPLGRRRHCELARRGVFLDARKSDGKWLVRRKELDAYIEAHPGPRRESNAEAEEAAEILAFRAPPRRKRR